MTSNSSANRCEGVVPTEENGYCLFSSELEDDCLVFFHATPTKHAKSILEHGFLSAAELGSNGLTSVSYAKRSSSCLAHIGNSIQEPYVVFAVRFASVSARGIKVNVSDIHVYDSAIQPMVLCFRELQSGFSVS
jgi:hypothetical protein